MKSTILKSLIFLALVFSFFAFTFFQNSNQENIFTFVEGNSDWKKINQDVEIDEKELLSRYRGQLGFGPKDVLVKHRESTDKAGKRHLHYQHYHDGVRVFASQIIIHIDEGRAYLVNGRVVEDMDKRDEASINKDEAIQFAKDEFPGSRFMWENEYMENWLKKVKHNPSATFAPSAPLVYYQKGLNREQEDYILTYEVDIHTYGPEEKAVLYINAKDGSIVDRINDLHTGGDHEGTAETRYHGTRTIITDSIGQDSFVLVDSTRGPGVFTFNANRLQPDSATITHFYDDDNFWNNVNGFQDEVATDAHWGAEMTYDFYTNVLGRQGMSGDSVRLIGFVHVDQNWTNATWNGVFARFGDSAAPNSPLTAIDVVAHEFAHGLTDYTADLVYMNESGALNESFSDIFGSVQEFLYDPETADWLIGEDFIATGGFRDMEYPNERGDPDTYFGQFWATGTGDNGGVHSNSGVQNVWFVILTEGRVGQNDIGSSFDVEALGLDKATQIAYGNLNNYLTVNSQYSDARLGAIQASIDLYGECSIEEQSTTNAWYAVGVGQKFQRNDIDLIEIIGPETEFCGTTEEESLTVRLSYTDCEAPLIPGAYVPFEYTVNFGDINYDTLFVTDTIFSRDTFDFTFSSVIAEFAEAGNYEINVNSTLIGDNVETNNHLREFYEIRVDQNFDFGYAESLSPISACYLTTEEEVSTRIQFLGCDSIDAGEQLEMLYRLDGSDWFSEFLVLDETYYSDDFIDFTFTNSTIDLEAHGYYEFEARLVYEDDTLTQNNSSEIEIFQNPIPLQRSVKFHFDGSGTTSLDSFYVQDTETLTVEILDSVGFKDTKGLAISGKNGLDLILDNRLEKVSLDNVWDENVNVEFKTESCVCADLTNSTQASLRYRINQTYSPIYEDILGSKMQYASAMRVTANGVKLSPTSIPVKNEDNPYLLKTDNLIDYLGGTVELCFQTHTLLNAENDPYGIGDNIYLDEVLISADFVMSTEEFQIGESVIFPNPTTEEFTIVNNWDLSYVVEIYDIEGKLVQKINKYTDNQRITSNHLNPGVYVVRSINGNSVSIGKVVLQ